ncbi:alpha/beta hydrolase family protein [Pseudophaeobacter sp.]|uniref:alpha/beta hydrolase family protein n=1 Tax=Pseudophaeobacter sp. TaxID=1971739 RepID=UPI0040592495
MTPSVTREKISFETCDGVSLKGDLIRGEDPQLAVLISAGTGFPRQFYQPLAEFLAERGAVVLTYDYRGIAESRSGDLAKSTIDLPDWGRFDMVAAVETLAQSAPGLRITHLAHSVGGHFLGLMSNHHRIDRHAFVAVGSGYFGVHHLRNRPLELYFWWGLGTYSLLRWGHLKAFGGWSGEALPPRVFRTWRRWSQRRSYFRPDFDHALKPQHYGEVTAPIRSWIFEDDPIATSKSAQDLMGCYPNAPKSLQLRSPSDIGVKRIGHDGAFRPGRERLWQECWDWLSQPDLAA